MRSQQFEDLRDFHDRGGADDAQAEGFGDGEFEAGGVGEGEVEDDGFVACRAEEVVAEGVEGGGQVVGYGLEGGAEGVHGLCLKGYIED